MGRPAKVWQRNGRGAYYTKHGGKLVNLGPDEAEAVAKLARLAADLGEALKAAGVPANAQPRASERVRAGTVAGLVPKYVADVRHRIKQKTATDVADRLAWLVRTFGARNVEHLDPLEVEREAGREGWRRGTVRQTLAAAQAFVRWAGCAAFRVRIPPAEYRGADCLVSAAEFVRAEAAAVGDYAAFLRVLWESGARPGEVRGLTVEGIDWRNAQAVLRDHKTAKSGKLRTIIFSPAAVLALTRQRVKYGSGLLFRNHRGHKLTMGNVNSRWRAIMATTGITAPTVYATRHAYITERLEAGVPAARVAALVGTSIGMIERTYSHVGQNIAGLRDVASREQAG
jgi:integrase